MISACHNARCGIHTVDYNKDNGRNNLEHFILCFKAISEKLRNGNGIIGFDGISAQLRRDKHPCSDCSQQQTDGDPHLADAGQINGTRQTHKHPCAHVRGSRAQSGDQAVHVSSAQEVLLFALALFGLCKEEYSYSYHKHKIDSDSAKFDCIQT